VPPRSWRLRIGDILEAIDAARECVEGLDEARLGQDRIRRLALISALTIIGEAASRLPAALVDEHPEIPWAEMRAMRNVVVHEYFGVDVQALWQTATADLPPLEVPLRALLERSSSSDSD